MANINGSNGDDTLNGTADDDNIDGRNGNDSIFGYDGDDDLEGGRGDDEVHGGEGDDFLDGGDGDDTLFGDDGNDTIRGLKDDDELHGGAGDDELDGGSGDDTLFGDDGDDLLEGISGDDVLDGGAGNDTLEGGSGEDSVDGGSGNDLIEGGSGHDTMAGGEGDDTIDGGSGQDTAVFSGSIADFALSLSGGNIIVTDLNTADGDEGTDTVFDDVEFLQFDDFTIDLTSQANNAPVALVGDQTIDEDSLLDFTLTLVDFDGDDVAPPVVTVTSNNSSTTPGSVSVIGSGILTPGYAGIGQATDFDIQYDPGDGYQFLAVGESVTETVTVTSTDENGASFVQTFDIVITGENDGPVAADDGGAGFVTSEDNALITGSVLLNDTDIDASDVLTVSASDAVSAGGALVTDNGDGTFSYDPNGQFESLAQGQSTTDTFSYTVSDGNGGSDTATVTITINGANDVPVGVDDDGVGFETDEDNAVVTANVLLNDTDVDDGAVLSVSAFDTTGTVGLVTDNGDGTFGYDPNGQFETLGVGETATDSFSYTVTDENGATDTATVTITINGANDAPTANDDDGAGFSTDEDTAFVTGSVLLNDTDPDNSAVLTVSGLDTTGTAGLVTDNGDGTFGYDPNGQFEALGVGETATDTFSYTVTDENGATDTATVTVTINGANDAPTANDDDGAGFSTNEDTAFVTGNVLVNDDDPDNGAVLSVSGLDTTGTEGLVTDNGDGTFGYDPNGQFESLGVGETATDTFSYTVTDENGATDTATVTITINGANDAPVALGDTATTLPGNAVDINVLGNDSDPDANDVLTIVDLIQPENGTITETGGIITYTPDAGFVGLDGFSYVVSDGNGGFDTANVAVTVDTPPAGNTAPVALAATIEAIADEGAPNILTIDFNTLIVDGFPIISDAQQSIAQLDITAIDLASDGRGSAEIVETSPGSNVFTIDLNEIGVQDGATAQFEISYTVDDGQPTDNTASNTIILQVTNPDGTPGNDAPVAGDATITQTEDDGNIVVTLLGAGGLASDPDVGDTLTITSLTFTDALGNVLEIDPLEEGNTDLVGGVVTINPVVFGLADTETGTFLLNYTVSDGQATATGAVTLNLTGTSINSAPTAEVGNEVLSDPADLITSDGGPRFEIDLNVLVDDIDQNDVTISLVSIEDSAGNPVNGSIMGGVVTITQADLALAAGDVADLVINYSADDGIAPVVNSVVNLTVNGPPEDPTGALIVDFENISSDTGFFTPVDNFAGFGIDGTATVLEVDEMIAQDPGRVPTGLTEGETTIASPDEGTAAVILGSFSGFDAGGLPEYTFTLSAPGATTGVIDGTVFGGLDPDTVFGTPFDFQGMSLTALDGPAITVTIIPYRSVEINFGQFEFVEVGSFDVTVSSASALALDFTSGQFVDDLNFTFDDPETTEVETGALENIVAVQIVTTGALTPVNQNEPSAGNIPTNDDPLVIDDLVFDF